VAKLFNINLVVVAHCPHLVLVVAMVVVVAKVQEVLLPAITVRVPSL